MTGPLPPSAVLAAALSRAFAARQRRELTLPGRRAGVLLALYDHHDQPFLVLTKRTTTLPTHRGQVSLPGGGWDPGDPDLRATALREAHEELGIPPSGVDILGELDDVHTAVSDYIVTPVVGHLATRPLTVPNPGEIARVIEVPVARILEIDRALPVNAGIATLRYPLCGEDVWGATARILRGFATVARDALDAPGSPGTGGRGEA